MALNRLLLGIFALTLVCGNSAFAQFDPTESKQDGILIMDAFGRLFSGSAEGTGTYFFKELEQTSQRFQFPFPVAKDVEFVADPSGNVNGAYVLDAFGGQFGLTLSTHPTFVTSPAELAAMNQKYPNLPYFGVDVAEDIEIAPDWRDATHGYRGYFVLDADGVVHSVGDNNLPFYVYNEEGSDVIKQTLFPNTIDITGSGLSEEDLLTSGPLTTPVGQPGSVNPLFLYFGSGTDIARDLEVSVEWVTVTVPAELAGSGVEETRRIAMTNGYYVMDGLGAVHSNRLALDFNVVDDTQAGEVQVTYKDLLDTQFGLPINNAPLAAPWNNPAIKGNLPYFPNDIAIDFELTPSGNGFFLLDAYGGIHRVGDAKNPFPTKIVNGEEVQSESTTPFFGFRIARDLFVTSNKRNDSLGLAEDTIATGLLVIDGFGTVHTAGLAESYSVSSKGNNGHSVGSFSLDFVAVEASPALLPTLNTNKAFQVGGKLLPLNVAPNFKDVSGAPYSE